MGISGHSEELARAVGGKSADAVEGGAAASEGGFVAFAFVIAVDGTGLDGNARSVEEAKRSGGERSSAAYSVQLVCLSGRVSEGFGAALE